MDVFTGTIVPTAFTYAPEGWALCNGQLLSISEYEALYALLGTRFGGDGKTTFGVPDLCGRTAVGAGTGLAPAPAVATGQIIGEAPSTVSMTGNAKAMIAPGNVPQVTVGAKVVGASLRAQSTLDATDSGTGATTPAPGAMLSDTGSTGGTSGAVYYTNPTPGTPLPSVSLSADSIITTLGGAATVSATLGKGQALAAPLDMAAGAHAYPMQPSLALNYIICTQGIFPDQS